MRKCFDTGDEFVEKSCWAKLTVITLLPGEAENFSPFPRTKFSARDSYVVKMHQKEFYEQCEFWAWNI